MKRTTALFPLCTRVQTHLDEVLATGEFTLPPLLETHAAQCPRCGPEVERTRNLFARLHAGTATVDLGPVAPAVDRVVVAALGQGHALARAQNTRAQTAAGGGPSWRWVLGQVSAVVALLVIVTGLLSWGTWRVADKVAGASPAGIASRAVQPFRHWIQAGLHNVTSDVRQ